MIFNNNDIVIIKKYNKSYIGMLVGVDTTGLIVEFLSVNKPTYNNYKCAVIKEEFIHPIDFIGLSLEDVRNCLKKSNHWTSRVVKQDGVDYVITMDLRLDRYNFEVEGGIIVKYDIF